MSDNYEQLIEAIEESSAHEDVAEFVRVCGDLGEQPSVLDGLQRFYDGGDGDVGKFLKYGTRKEKLLWNHGAAVALERVGNWDVNNKPILEAIVQAKVAERQS